jgi:hypothetical protein
MAMRMRASRLLIAAGLLALLTACESLPDERALAVNDPAFSPARSWKPRSPEVPVLAGSRQNPTPR